MNTSIHAIWWSLLESNQVPAVMSRLLDLRAKEPYTRLSRVSPTLHTLRQGKGFPPLFHVISGTYMVRAVQVQASSLMRAIAPHTSGWRRGAAPHLPASPTNRRRSTLGASHVIALAPWPLVLWLSPRPAWAKIRNSLPLCPHAGLGTYKIL